MSEMMQEPEGEVVEETATEVEQDHEEGQQPEAPVKSWSDEKEAEARAFGWKSPDEWQGEKPPGYIDDPETYLERLNNFTPFRKSREQLEETKREFDQRMRRFEAMQEQALHRQKQQYEARLQEIAAGKRRAVEEADTQTYERLEQQERALGAPPEMPQPPQAQEPPPEVQQYIRENEWAQDPALWEEAARAVDFNRDVRKKPAGKQLQYAESVMRRRYPHLFEQPKPRPQRQMVDGGGLGGGRQKSAFDKLPTEAKDQFRKFVKEGLFTDDEAGKREYADEYNAF